MDQISVQFYGPGDLFPRTLLLPYAPEVDDFVQFVEDEKDTEYVINARTWLLSGRDGAHLQLTVNLAT